MKPNVRSSLVVLFAAAVLAATACDRNHSQRTRRAIPAAPAVSLDFPTGPAGTDAASLRVRGRASGPRAIQGVRVNGVDATSSDGFAHWEADVSLARGTTTLTVEVVDVGGATATTSLPFERVGRIMDEPSDVTVDPAAGVAYYIDEALRAVFGIPLDPTGPTFVSNDFHGSGAPFFAPSALAYDAANSRLIVFDRDTDPPIVAVDPASGDRTPISGSARGTGPLPVLASTLVVDAAGATAYFYDLDDQAYYAIDLASGDRTIVSDSTHGSGPLPFDSAVAIDEARGRLVATDLSSFPSALLAIDLATGDRTVISDASTGSGPALNPFDVSVAPGRDDAIVTNGDSVLAVDLVTGDRTVVSSGGVGSGPAFSTALRIEASEALGLAVVVDQDSDFDRLVIVELATGDRDQLAGTPLVGSGAIFIEPQSLAFDAAHDRIVLLDEAESALLSIDPITGGRELLSGGSPTIGSGPLFDDDPTAIALDAAGARAFVVTEEGLLFSVALASGDRTLLSDSTHGSGPDLDTPTAIALDAARGRVLVTDENFVGVIAVEIATGDRRVLADATTGSGPALDDPHDLVVDAPNLRALVSDVGLAAIVAVDLLTGDRTILSGPGVGSGPDFAFVGSSPLVLDATRNRVIVLDADAPGRLLAVDLGTGDRSVFADDSGDHGLGPTFNEIESLVLDPARDVFYACDEEQVTCLAIDPASGDRVVIAQGVED